MKKYRKAFGAFFGGVITLAGAFGFDIPPEVGGAAATMVSTLLVYTLPNDSV